MTAVVLDVDCEHGTSNEKSFSVTTMYKTYCSNGNCRANSAVIRFLDSVTSTRPLTDMPFQNFYLGPRGFLPVLELIENNQTIEAIDLRGNGLDNNCIASLCHVLEKHLGVQQLLVGSNPITVEGGKHLIALLERNRRIIKVDVSETNVYDSMSQRLQMQSEINAGTASNAVALVPSKPVVSRNGSAPTQLTASVSKPSKPEISLVDVETPSRRAVGGSRSSPPKRRPSPTMPTSTELRHDAGTGAPKPRPPPPALISREASRWTERQRQDLLSKYHERATLYQQVVRSDASRAADRAREELMRIEQRSVVEATNATTAAPVTHHTTHDHDAAGANSSGPRKSTVPNTTDKRHTGVFESSPDLGFTTAARWSLSDLPQPSATQSEDSRGDLPARRTTGTNPLEEDDTEPETALVLQPLTLTRDEQFKELFTKGCQLYNDKQLDAAYLTWNEAMDMAVTNKNREWMAVISNNLQRLSYEILVAEGVQHLDDMRLEEADKAFQLALDVASKSKNAMWEGEMHKARKNVQHAVFQRSHETALRLFERAQNSKDVAVTSDDRFTLPGDPPGRLREYSAAFVSEWSRMLLIKEAMEMWADATMVARRISGSSGKVLGEVVTAAVDSVCGFLARKFLVPEPHGNILSLQHTSNLSYHECMRLIELWTDLVSKTQTSVSNRAWDAVGASILGNLFLATHQLPQALNQFEKLIDVGSERRDSLLLGLGNSYLGILHWQRSNYAVSERCFLAAMDFWRRLRVNHGRQQVDEQGGASTTEVDEMGLSVLAHAPDGTSDADGAPQQFTSTLANNISIEYLNVMLSKCFTYLIRILFTTSRYRDALEMLERGLLHRYKDRLHDKMLRNFTSKPTIDHIQAVATSLDSPLVYYETSYRFDWNPNHDAYDVSQQLMVWVVVKEAEMKVIRVDVTNDFGVASIDVLLEQARNSLCVVPIPHMGVQDAIITKLPEQSWREPLAKLYEILFHPVEDFISAHNAYKNQQGGLVTIIPSSNLWLVPFNGLLMRTGKFLVEEYAVQHAFCSMQAAFGALSARRVRDRDLKKRISFVYPSDASQTGGEGHRLIDHHKTPFPIDAIRSFREGQRLLDAHAVTPGATASHRGGRSPATDAITAGAAIHKTTSGVSSERHRQLTPECELIEDVHVLRDVISKARVLHFATATCGVVDNEDGTAGALFVPLGSDDLGLLRSSEIASYDIMAEVVVMSQSNMAAERIRTTKEGTLGLCRGFLSAGVASVVFSQWCTPDMLPVEIFEPFYQLVNSRREPHKARALAAALRKLLADDRYRYNPRFWCGFVLVGVGLL